MAPSHSSTHASRNVLARGCYSAVPFARGRRTVRWYSLAELRRAGLGAAHPQRPGRGDSLGGGGDELDLAETGEVRVLREAERREEPERRRVVGVDLGAEERGAWRCARCLEMCEVPGDVCEVPGDVRGAWRCARCLGASRVRGAAARARRAATWTSRRGVGGGG